MGKNLDENIEGESNGIAARVSTRFVTPVVPQPVKQETITIELPREIASQVYNFVEYATRTDAYWRGYKTGTNDGVSLESGGGRTQAEDLARALAKVLGGGMMERQHRA